MWITRKSGLLRWEWLFYRQPIHKKTLEAVWNGDNDNRIERTYQTHRNVIIAKLFTNAKFGIEASNFKSLINKYETLDISILHDPRSIRPSTYPIDDYWIEMLKWTWFELLCNRVESETWNKYTLLLLRVWRRIADGISRTGNTASMYPMVGDSVLMKKNKREIVVLVLYYKLRIVGNIFCIGRVPGLERVLSHTFVQFWSLYSWYNKAICQKWFYQMKAIKMIRTTWKKLCTYGNIL